MAKVVFGGAVTGIRGKYAGAIFSANASSAYVKNFRAPVNPRTTRQQIVRSYLPILTEAWRLLSSANKTAWDTWFADPAQERTNSLGEPYYLSGYQGFISYGSNRLQFGLALNTAAPTLATPTGTGSIELDVQTTGGGLWRVDRDTWTPTGTLIYVMSLTPPVTTARSQRPPGEKVVWYQSSDWAGWLDISAGALPIFGTPIIGQKTWLQFAIQNADGQRRVWALNSAIVTV